MPTGAGWFAPDAGRHPSDQQLLEAVESADDDRPKHGRSGTIPAQDAPAPDTPQTKMAGTMTMTKLPITTAQGASGVMIGASVSNASYDAAGWRPELGEREDRQGPRLLTIAPWCYRALPLAAGFKPQPGRPFTIWLSFELPVSHRNQAGLDGRAVDSVNPRARRIDPAPRRSTRGSGRPVQLVALSHRTSTATRLPDYSPGGSGRGVLEADPPGGRSLRRLAVSRRDRAPTSACRQVNAGILI